MKADKGKMQKLMPVVFVGHGSPMNAIQDNEFTKALNALRIVFKKPKVVLCISAHWVTDGTFITSSGNPMQIYDFTVSLRSFMKSNTGQRVRSSFKRIGETLSDFNADMDSERGMTTEHGQY